VPLSADFAENLDEAVVKPDFMTHQEQHQLHLLGVNMPNSIFTKDVY
jgi:hypothetical protein